MTWKLLIIFHKNPDNDSDVLKKKQIYHLKNKENGYTEYSYQMILVWAAGFSVLQEKLKSDCNTFCTSILKLLYKILVSNNFNFSDNLSEKASRDEKKKNQSSYLSW